MFSKIKITMSYLLIMLIAFFAALNFIIFVFPNKFAPAGVDGICTMIQYLLNVNMGYLSLVANIPLLIAAFIVLNREFAAKTAVYTVSFSLSVILLKSVDLTRFLYITDTVTSIVLAPVAAGVIRGLLYVVTLRQNGSGGGTDIISALIKHKKPHLDIMNVIFILNTFIALISYFVYGMSLEPVICSIIYAFVSSTVCAKIRLAGKENVKFEIITQDAEKLCLDITERLNQKATVVDVHGAYSGQAGKMVICKVKKETAPYREDLLLSYKGSVVFKSIVDDSVLGIAYK